MYFERKVADMGEPDSTQSDLIREIALAALHPNKQVSSLMLRKSGLHREVLRGVFQAFKPEIKNLTGWAKLNTFHYRPYWRNPDMSDIDRGEKLTGKWCEELKKLELSDEQAVLLYDGEALRPPAHDYRLFLLRDMRLLYYAGGFHANFVLKPPVCGSVLDVLDALEALYSPETGGLWREEPFVVMMSSFDKALETSVQASQRKATDQAALSGRMKETISSLG